MIKPTKQNGVYAALCARRRGACHAKICGKRATLPKRNSDEGNNQEGRQAKERYITKDRFFCFFTPYAKINDKNKRICEKNEPDVLLDIDENAAKHAAPKKCLAAGQISAHALGGAQEKIKREYGEEIHHAHVVVKGLHHLGLQIKRAAHRRDHGDIAALFAYDLDGAQVKPHGNQRKKENAKPAQNNEIVAKNFCEKRNGIDINGGIEILKIAVGQRAAVDAFGIIGVPSLGKGQGARVQCADQKKRKSGGQHQKNAKLPVVALRFAAIPYCTVAHIYLRFLFYMIVWQIFVKKTEIFMF